VTAAPPVTCSVCHAKDCGLDAELATIALLAILTVSNRIDVLIGGLCFKHRCGLEQSVAVVAEAAGRL
jgi:hypothetical protein